MMDSTLRPYPSYKPSHVPWLGDMPAHWEVRRGKTLFQPVDVRSQTGNEELLTVSAQRGVVPRKSANVTMFKAESYVGYKLCWPGDLVINSLWAWAHGLGVSRYHGIVSSAYGVYRLLPKFKNYASFIHRLVRSIPFQWELQVRSKGIWISRLQLTDEAFLGAPFPLPPLSEQTAIVRYLDHADERIRRYVSGKQKLIRLLEEEKQAVIHRAVTRGLPAEASAQAGRDPDVRLKPSGVEWLGDIPAHWEVRRIRNSVDMRVSNVDKHINNNELPIRLCNYVDVYKNDRITESVAFMRATATADEIERFRLKQGDRPRYAKDSEEWNDIGVAGLFEYRSVRFGLRLSKMALAPSLCTTLTQSRNDFFRSMCMSTSYCGVLAGLMQQLNGVRLQYAHCHYEAIKFGALRAPLPPLPEQTAIVRYLDKATAAIDTAIDRARRQIELLQRVPHPV